MKDSKVTSLKYVRALGLNYSSILQFEIFIFYNKILVFDKLY